MAAGFFNKLKTFLAKTALFGTKLLQNKVLTSIADKTVPYLGTVTSKVGGALESVLHNAGY